MFMQQAGDELDLGGGVNDLEASRDDHNADQDEASGMVGAVSGGGREDGPDETGALPRHKWHPHTVKVWVCYSLVVALHARPSTPPHPT